jgi:DNA replication and repair protein RecF
MRRYANENIMIFEKLRLVNFRNYQDVTVSFSSRINFLVGENGQGKTNLVEALYLLTNGTSFRYSNNLALINTSKTETIIQSLIKMNELNYKISLYLSKSRKNLTINEKRVSITNIKRDFTTVIFSPESLSSIKEGSDYRRELIDDFLITFDKKNSELISEYGKVLRTRNKVLRNFKQGIHDKLITQNLLASLNPIFVRLGADLTYMRIRALHGLAKDLNNAMQYITGDNQNDLSVEYKASDQNILELNRDEIGDLIQRRILELSDSELLNSTSLVGPHKHEIVFLYGQKDSRFYCSQGQQRAIILSFKMAQIVYHRKAHGTYPVLILDDVLSELDKAKKEALIKFLHEINTQIFITTTDITLPEVFSLDEISVSKVKDGQILL